MTFLPLMLLLTLTTAQADEWKLFAETTKCPVKLQVLTKEGETFIKVARDGREEQLMTKDQAPFRKNSPHKVLYRSQDENKKLGDFTYTFVQPAMMEKLLPKIEISGSGVQHLCDMRVR